MLRLLTRPITRDRRPRLLVPLLLLLAAGMLWQTRTVSHLDAQALVPVPRFNPALSLPAPDDPPVAVNEADVPLPITVEPGQTLGGLLESFGLAADDANAALAALAPHLDIRRVRAGTTGLAYRDDRAQLTALRLDRTDGWVEIRRIGSEWDGQFHEFEQQVLERRIAGSLEGSLESSIRAVGGDPRVAYRMADVLQWDLDFSRDLRTGDRFGSLYEERYVDDRYVGPGQILAMTYENRGSRLEAYRFDDAYYDAEGRPLQKMFLRCPLPFSRVTSRFSKSRFHPVLKVNRPHWGVDYGAPKGTPVRVTAHGSVVSVGRSGGAGKMVKVRHPNGYLSAYLHLSGYAKGLRSGGRVRQGDVIGYVGSTGLSTGPHLDYRVQKNGRWIDPLSLDRTRAEPISAQRMAAFLAARDGFRRDMRTDREAALPLRVATSGLHSASPAALR